MTTLEWNLETKKIGFIAQDDEDLGDDIEEPMEEDEEEEMSPEEDEEENLEY